MEASTRGAQPSLAGYAVPQADETKHFKIIGTTGTGKSTAICAAG
jgi:type IV secretory pathway VirB4 component